MDQAVGAASLLWGTYEAYPYRCNCGRWHLTKRNNRFWDNHPQFQILLSL